VPHIFRGGDEESGEGGFWRARSRSFSGRDRSCAFCTSCYVAEINTYSSVRFQAGRAVISLYFSLAGIFPHSANIGMDGPIGRRFPWTAFRAATSCTTSTDLDRLLNLHGAHGTTWVAGIIMDSISRVDLRWLMPSRSDASSIVRFDAAPGDMRSGQLIDRLLDRDGTRPFHSKCYRFRFFAPARFRVAARSDHLGNHIHAVRVGICNRPLLRLLHPARVECALLCHCDSVSAGLRSSSQSV